jgi:hypothetical protein
MMDGAKEFWAAFLVAQQQMDAASKNKANPHLKSKYADLGSVIDECKPALNGAGLVYTQHPEACRDGVIGVRTKVVHAGTGYVGIDAVTEIPCGNDAQKAGSAITYAKRYALQAVCGIPSEDDDGHLASKLISPPRKEAPAPAKSEPRQEHVSASPQIMVELRKRIGAADAIGLSALAADIKSMFESGTINADDRKALLAAFSSRKATLAKGAT